MTALIVLLALQSAHACIWWWKCIEWRQRAGRNDAALNECIDLIEDDLARAEAREHYFGVPVP